jgi:hypothetical protein
LKLYLVFTRRIQLIPFGKAVKAHAGIVFFAV